MTTKGKTDNYCAAVTYKWHYIKFFLTNPVSER